MLSVLSDRKSLFKWMVPLAAGFVFVLMGFKIYKTLHPNYPPLILQRASEMQMPAQEAQDMDRIFMKLAYGATVTESDWKAIRSLIESDKIGRKRFALLMLGTLNKTPYRQEAIHYAEQLVNNSNSTIQSLAISDLAKLHDSRWKPLALKNQNSPDPTLKNSAIALLSKQERYK